MLSLNIVSHYCLFWFIILIIIIVTSSVKQHHIDPFYVMMKSKSIHFYKCCYLDSTGYIFKNILLNFNNLYFY